MPSLPESAGMERQEQGIVIHPAGEQPMDEARSAIADALAGRVHVEWDATAPVTPFGQRIRCVAAWPRLAKPKACPGCAFRSIVITDSAPS
jgi:hypothetical protein